MLIIEDMSIKAFELFQGLEHVDCYTKEDPGRVFELEGKLGEGSPSRKSTATIWIP
jgi:hypothetical protein